MASFEDVNIDDELEPLDRTPTEDDALRFMGQDPATKSRFSDSATAQREGFRGAVVPGLMKLAWITSYASDWAGQGATVRSVRVAYRRPDFAGNPLMVAGRVVDKREEDGRKLVDLEVVTLMEDGQPSVRGNVQVEFEP